MKTKQLITFFVALLCILLNKTIHAQWSTNTALNNAICTAGDMQNDQSIISDGFGGAIITWRDNRIGELNIYAQRINACGVVQWAANGVVICNAINNQVYPSITTDGNGGAIITWDDYRSGANYDIYAQRINASGVVQWTANGVAICTAANGQTQPEITSDGSQGAIITWEDGRSSVSQNDIYAQRINASGAVQWTVNGVAVCTSARNQEWPRITSDGIQGAIITWMDYRTVVVGGTSGTVWDIYAQRINASGVVQWTTNGVSICSAADQQQYPDITFDGIGGAIITWEDWRGGGGGNADIYAQRINASGLVQWPVDGVAICTVANPQGMPTIISDGFVGAFITWYDGRTGNSDIYAQRINASGVVQWTANGVAICTTANNQGFQKITSDGSGGAIISWQDQAVPASSTSDIYAQRINASGIVQWIANGVAISTAANNQQGIDLISDGSGGTIISWDDYRGGSWNIFAQRVNADGNLGNPGTPGAISGASLACFGSSNTYSVTAIAGATSYIWTLPGGWSGTSTTNNITTTAGVTGGNITVTANSSCGSSAASSLAITVNPLPIAAGPITGTASVCQGQNSVTYTLPSITNATTYIWTLPSGAIGTSSINIITVNYSISAVSGNITVKGNNACGDGATSTLAITVNPSPTVTVNSPSICIGDVATINVSGAATYTWSTGAITPSISVSPTITTNYSVVCTNSLGCSNSKTATVTVNVAPTLNISSTNTLICVGETATITANSSASIYSWSNGSSSSSIVVTPSVTTIYTITVSNGLCNSNSSYTQSVSVCTSLNELKNNSIKIYPNPASAELTISSPIKFTDVKIVNSIGQIVQESKYNNTVSIMELSNGIYFLKLFNENGNLLKVAKFIKE